MFKTLALENLSSLTFGRSRARRAVSYNAGIPSWRILAAAGLLALNLTLLMSYIYGINESASRGFEIQELQTKVSNLSADNKALTLKLSTATSMVSIQQDFLSANFVPAGTPNFINTIQLSRN